MHIIDASMLDSLSGEARDSVRRRKNLNFHRDYSELCQRMLNAVEPGSYIRPHRHLDPPKPETFVALRGRFVLLLFADDGSVRQVVPFAAEGPVFGADVEPGAWHSVIALDAGSVFFETKPGPYEPLSDKDWAPWAPAEGDPGAADYLETLEKAALHG